MTYSDKIFDLAISKGIFSKTNDVTANPAQVHRFYDDFIPKWRSVENPPRKEGEYLCKVYRDGYYIVRLCDYNGHKWQAIDPLATLEDVVEDWMFVFDNY